MPLAVPKGADRPQLAADQDAGVARAGLSKPNPQATQPIPVTKLQNRSPRGGHSPTASGSADIPNNLDTCRRPTLSLAQPAQRPYHRCIGKLQPSPVPATPSQRATSVNRTGQRRKAPSQQSAPFLGNHRPSSGIHIVGAATGQHLREQPETMAHPPRRRVYRKGFFGRMPITIPRHLYVKSSLPPAPFRTPAE